MGLFPFSNGAFQGFEAVLQLRRLKGAQEQRQQVAETSGGRGIQATGACVAVDGGEFSPYRVRVTQIDLRVRWGG
jgi:hypothetical protein